ncbi:dihydrouridine synthase-domain-containing protein [Pelagophyceae sp. CCMP2097]|nr:dihydrouridine synthase-domain-containing protein [Pelagophyceae sp. CCMP2097]|mmetsp:Transcript_14465/g.48439  ORF Transcript_14465/g.48439 Transcript_14465/m.48439 type:complete len:399 (+) Transcript_14465:144-1340(+)
MASDARYAYPYSVAPMMGVTDRHWRYFARGLSARTLLYTEMYVDNTLVHNPNGLGPFLGRSAEDEPLALQLGGNDPETLAAAADLACAYTEYVEVNLNCGCPSAVVATRHEFGARMMLDPERTARCVSALVRRVGHKAPVTVKHRLGTDVGGADYATTLAFVMACRQAGARHFVLHARMAVLGVRMSCASNRSVPPLEPAAAHKLRRDVPDCTFAVNGGLQTLVECRAHVQGDWAGEEALPPVDSAMVGRSAWYTPWDTLARADTVMFGAAGNMATTRRAALERYVDYADAMRPDIDTAESHLIAPLHYLFGGESRAKAFRTHLAQACVQRSRSKKSFDEMPPCSEVVYNCLKAAGIEEASLDRHADDAKKGPPAKTGYDAATTAWTTCDDGAMGSPD